MARGRVIMPEHFAGVMDGKPRHGEKQTEIDLLSLPFHKAVAELEKRLIERAIREAENNKTDAANRLQINRRLLYKKMAEHKIEE